MRFNTALSFLGLLIPITFCSVPSSTSAQGVVWPVNNGGNGHTYQLVTGATTWTGANAAAQVQGGYLASVTSAAENEFIVGTLGSGQPDGVNWYLLGGFQPAHELAADRGWRWVTGEAWSFANWSGGEPNDYFGPGSEQFLMYDKAPAEWNDVPDDWVAVGYILEKDGYVVPEPSPLMLLSLVVPISWLLRARPRPS